MAGAEDGRRQHQVHCSAIIAKALQQIQHDAKGSTQREAIASAFKQIVKLLQDNPQAVGEPYYRLPTLLLQIRTCVVYPLVVHFAVCEDRPLVFIKAVKLLGFKRKE